MDDTTEDSVRAPDKATDAVLKPSVPVSPNAREVRGVEFSKYENTPLTVEELVANMACMGFQASAVSEAVRIVNEMVCPGVSTANLPSLS